MSEEDQIKWVALKLDFSPEHEAVLQKRAQASGLSIECYCLHLLYKNLLEEASAAQKEQWQRNLPATLRRNVVRNLSPFEQPKEKIIFGLREGLSPMDKTQLLPRRAHALFEKVVLPTPVLAESSARKAPPVRYWIANPPAWIEVREPPDGFDTDPLLREFTKESKPPSPWPPRSMLTYC
jgi:hypothetical protein